MLCRILPFISLTYGNLQEVCPYSGVIVNKEESRMRDHRNGRNYRSARTLDPAEPLVTRMQQIPFELSWCAILFL